jgi:hypothetical protein
MAVVSKTDAYWGCSGPGLDPQYSAFCKERKEKRGEMAKGLFPRQMHPSDWDFLTVRCN